MAATLPVIQRPEPTADYRAKSPQRFAGPLVSVVGMMVVVIAFIGGFVMAQRFSNAFTSAQAGDDLGALSALRSFGRINAWAFGFNTLGLAVAKIGIVVVLVGIVLRLWMRVDSVKWSLSRLKPDGQGEASAEVGDIDATFTMPASSRSTTLKATASDVAPERRVIDKAARVLWFPMAAMGFMLVAGGFVISLFWAGTNQLERTATFLNAAAWTQGMQFLGEAMLLGGISFLLGTILASLREGGGEVQQSLGVTVKTLKMPLSAKAFIVLMAMGMMGAMVQFVLYIVSTGVSTADGTSSIDAWFAWLGPLREVSLGLLLSGIVLALYTIGTVLGFQFDRIKTILRTGR